MTFVAPGFLVGIASVLCAPRLGSASNTAGLLWEHATIAPVIIGGTRLPGGIGRIRGTVVGVAIPSPIDSILNLTDLVSPYLNGVIQGVIINLAVVLQRARISSR